MEDRGAWKADAACKGQTDLFFSEDSRDQATAKATCRHCRVRKECKQAALAEYEPYGVWGGLTPVERWQLVEGAA